MKITFNKPSVVGNEINYIIDAINKGKISGDGYYSKKCQSFFEDRYKIKKCLLTTSCTDALEMAALLLNIQPGDEVIMPSYTFVSTSNAFVLRGAKIVFADSRTDHPGMDEDQIEPLITPKTKAIVVVHYAGIACDFAKIKALTQKYSLFLIEDAAQAIDSYYQNTPLGSIGDMAAFSFHETKNVICGEGGLLAINNEAFVKRAEIIREKGTNRTAFFNGEVDKYGWVDIGSSFLPSDILAAFLYAQLEEIDTIQNKRKAIWQQYYDGLKAWAEQQKVTLPIVPHYATNNGHIFYLVCPSLDYRTRLIEHLKANGIHAVFHYQSLHKSQFYTSQYTAPHLPQTDRYTDTLLRLPLYYELSEEAILHIINTVNSFGQ